MNRNQRLIFLFAALFSCPARGAPAIPQTQPAAIFSFPSAVRPGASTHVKFFEPGIGEPIGLWCSFPAAVAPATEGGKSGEARYTITPAADVPVGIYAARLLTSVGVSHLRLLMVDDLPSIINRGGNITPALAREVSLPTAIDARCEPLTADYYRLAAKKGQRLSAEVVAQRLGSPMDPMIRLLDAGGRELVYCDDAPGVGSDCRFSYVFPADGRYLIEVRDVNYDGGRAYFYRLRLGDFPLITSVSPLGGKRGAEARFHPQSARDEELGDVSLTLPRNADRTWLNVKYPQGQGCGFASVLCTDLEERVVFQPNDTPQTANRVALPVAITGRFDPRGRPAYFEFQAGQGEVVAIRGLARALGSGATLSLQLLDAAGAIIAESKPESPGDASIGAAIPTAGLYRVLARELSGSAGPGMFYRLEIREVKPGFSLSVDTDVVNAVAGQSFKLKVGAARRSFTGPISLTLTGDASTFSVKSATIPAGKNDVELEVIIPAGLAPTQPLNFQIVGKATVGDVEMAETASTQAALKKLFPKMPYPPPELDGLIGLGVK